jgi:CheY-like chemotaxis protein
VSAKAAGKAIRQEDAHIPVIYISGHVEDADLNRPEDGFAVIAKPFLPKALLKAVSLTLKQAKRPG